MKILNFHAMTTVFVLAVTGPVLAGGVAGGGGPPALKNLQEMVQASERKTAVFAWDAERLGLGVDAELQPQMSVTRDASNATALRVSSEEFARIAESTPKLEVINLHGDMRSYHVRDGSEPNTLILMDRRELVRRGLSR